MRAHNPVATHEASGAPASHGFPSVFLKQASTPPFLEAFTPAEFRAWLFDFRAFLARFHLHTWLDRLPPSSPVVRDEGAAVVWFLLQQALKPAMTQATASGRVLQLMLTVLHRRATSPAETLQQLATHLGISTTGEMDMLELTLINFAPLPAEPLEQFVWRLHLARDEYNSRAPFYQLPKYSDRKLFKQLLMVLPQFLSDLFMAPLLAIAPTDFLSFGHVSHLIHEHINFDKARRAPPILLGRHVSTSSGVGT